MTVADCKQVLFVLLTFSSRFVRTADEAGCRSTFAYASLLFKHYCTASYRRPKLRTSERHGGDRVHDHWPPARPYPVAPRQPDAATVTRRVDNWTRLLTRPFSGARRTWPEHYDAAFKRHSLDRTSIRDAGKQTAAAPIICRLTCMTIHSPTNRTRYC